MTVSTFAINNLVVTQNHGCTIITAENMYRGGTHSTYVAQVLAIDKGVYTFVECQFSDEQTDAAYEGAPVYGTFPTLQAAAQAAFDFVVEMVTKIENDFAAGYPANEVAKQAIFNNYKFIGNHIVLTNEANETIYDENDQMIILAMVVECKGKHTGKFTAINRTGLSQVEVWDALTIAEDKPTAKFTSPLFAEKYAEMLVQNMFNNELCALEAFADAANQLLHIDIAAEVAEQDAAQAASEAIAEANDIDFIQVYIDGKPHEYATNELIRKGYASDFLDETLPVNETVKLNGDLLYLEEVILDTCFAHGENWEFWANPAHPDEKTLLMIYVSTTPIKARKKPKYPQQDDYFDYAYGGDGYTADEVLDI